MISLVIISGRSGSGKSTALHVLEDMGYYCIDNLPVGLLPPLLDRLAANQVTQKVSVSIDARNVAAELANFQQIIAAIDQENVKLDIVYLDSAGSTLVKRFSETRRKHPLSTPETNLREALEKEAELLDSIASSAHLSIDTTSLTIHELRDMIKSRVAGATQDFALLFESFAYKNGVPVDADLVFDVRCLPNPHWKPNLRNLTGLDQPVENFLGDLPEVKEMLDDITRYLKRWLPTFEANNRSYMTVAIGCTGGQHRSVYVAKRLHEQFAPMWDNVQIRHRELNRVAVKQEDLKFN